MSDEDIVIAAIVEDAYFTVEQFCAVCSIEQEWIIHHVQEGLFPISGAVVSEWRFSSGDLRRAQRMRDIVQYFNGKKRFEGWDVLRQDHLDGFLRSLPDGSPGIEDYSLKKTLRMACGDMLGVEFASSFRDRRTGAWVDEHGAEFWRVKADRLTEWHAYATERSRLDSAESQ
jgi:chaperone modulatory protein CbpM